LRGASRSRQQPRGHARLEAAEDRRGGLPGLQGALVAIDPKTAKCWRSSPSRDSTEPLRRRHRPQNWDALNNSPDKPLNNRALRGQYPPGSTIKPFMALAALEYKKRSPEFTISDPGYFTLAGVNHRYRDWKKEGHGWSTCTSRS